MRASMTTACLEGMFGDSVACDSLLIRSNNFIQSSDFENMCSFRGPKNDGLVFLKRGCNPGEVCMHSCDTGDLLMILNGNVSKPNMCNVSLDGKAIVVALEDNTVLMFDLNMECNGIMMAAKHEMVGHTAPVYGMIFSPDNKMLLTGANDGCLRLWDVRTGQCMSVLRNLTAKAVRIMFATNATTIAALFDNNCVRMWNHATNHCVQMTVEDCFIESVGVSPDGRILIVGWNGMHEFYDLVSRQCVYRNAPNRALGSFAGGLSFLYIQPPAANDSASGTDCQAVSKSPALSRGTYSSLTVEAACESPEEEIVPSMIVFEPLLEACVRDMKTELNLMPYLAALRNMQSTVDSDIIRKRNAFLLIAALHYPSLCEWLQWSDSAKQNNGQSPGGMLGCTRTPLMQSLCSARLTCPFRWPGRQYADECPVAMNGPTMMHLAAAAGRCDNLRLMFELGAKCGETFLCGTGFRVSVLDCGLFNNSVRNLCLQHLDCMCSDRAAFLASSLCAATAACTGGIVQCLLEAGADPCMGDMTSAVSPLHIAAAQVDASMLCMLLPYAKDIDVQDEEGRSPLMFATGNGCDQTMAALITCGANVWCRDRRGWCPITTCTQVKIRNSMMQGTANYRQRQDAKSTEGAVSLLQAQRLRCVLGPEDHGRARIAKCGLFDGEYCGPRHGAVANGIGMCIVTFDDMKYSLKGRFCNGYAHGPMLCCMSYGKTTKQLARLLAFDYGVCIADCTGVLQPETCETGLMTEIVSSECDITLHEADVEDTAACCAEVAEMPCPRNSVAEGVCEEPSCEQKVNDTCCVEEDALEACEEGGDEMMCEACVSPQQASCEEGVSSPAMCNTVVEQQTAEMDACDTQNAEVEKCELQDDVHDAPTMTSADECATGEPEATMADLFVEGPNRETAADDPETCATRVSIDSENDCSIIPDYSNTKQRRLQVHSRTDTEYISSPEADKSAATMKMMDAQVKMQEQMTQLTNTVEMLVRMMMAQQKQ